MSFKRKQANLQQANGKPKKEKNKQTKTAISELTEVLARDVTTDR